MPNRSWKYRCCLQCGSEPVCAEHGRDGIFVGWWPTDSERSAQFVRVYGLAPRGEARTLAPVLLGTLRRTCRACRGSGWFGTKDDDAPIICPGCDGLGGFWARPMEEVAAARDQILRVEPGVGTGWAAHPQPRGGA